MTDVKQPKYDSTLIGTIKIFLNNWKIIFCPNGAYYLVDPFGNSQHFCSYTKRQKMFSFIERMDTEFNLSESEVQMGNLLFTFTGKPNCWHK